MKYNIGDIVKIDHIRGFNRYDGCNAIVVSVNPPCVTYNYDLLVETDKSGYLEQIFADEHELV